MRYLPDPAKLLKTILKRKRKKKRRKKVEGKRRRKISNYGIRVPKYKKEVIKNIAKVKEDIKQILLEVVQIRNYSEVMKNLLDDENYERFNKMLKDARKKRIIM